MTYIKRPYKLTDGGTGADNASDARYNLSAAKSGANSDITSLSALSTPLSIGQGGTGLNSSPSNGSLLIGNGSGFTSSHLTSNLSTITVTNTAGGINLESSSAINAVFNARLTTTTGVPVTTTD